MKLSVADHFDTEPKTTKDAVSGTVAAGLNSFRRWDAGGGEDGEEGRGLATTHFAGRLLLNRLMVK